MSLKAEGSIRQVNRTLQRRCGAVLDHKLSACWGTAALPAGAQGMTMPTVEPVVGAVSVAVVPYPMSIIFLVLGGVLPLADVNTHVSAEPGGVGPLATATPGSVWVV